MAQEIAFELYGWTIGSRYDKVIMSEDSVSIYIPKKDPIKIRKPRNLPLLDWTQSRATSFAQFKANLRGYLKELSPVVGDLIDEAKEARFDQMPNAEQESWATQKAKGAGIPADVIMKLASSSFLFALYTPVPKGSVTIDEIKTKIGKSKVTTYETSVDLLSEPKLLIYRFDGDSLSFKKYDELQGTSLTQVGESASYPTKRAAERGIEDLVLPAIKASYNAAGTSLRYELTKDDNFAIIEPVEGVENIKVYATIGTQEDLRVDQPYSLRHTAESGKTIKTGFVKARKVWNNKAKNAPMPNANIDGSEFHLIQGSVDEMISQLRETPWTGAAAYIAYSQNPFKTQRGYIRRW